MEQLDLVARTAEQARIFGIDFFSVLSGAVSTGSSPCCCDSHTQLRLISPNKEQVARQPAMECLPVMEPESDVRRSSGCSGFPVALSTTVIAYNLLLYAHGKSAETSTAAMEAPSRGRRRDLVAVPPPSALQSSRCLAAYSHRSSTATDRRLRPE